MKIIVATSKNEESAVVLTVWPVDVSFNRTVLKSWVYEMLLIDTKDCKYIWIFN